MTVILVVKRNYEKESVNLKWSSKKYSVANLTYELRSTDDHLNTTPQIYWCIIARL